MSPEGLSKRKFIGKTDVYSLGMTMLLFMFEKSMALKGGY
jgi:hypothetical protein